jgi:hypothetical protein
MNPAKKAASSRRTQGAAHGGFRQDRYDRSSN